MAYINIKNELPGILGLMAYQPGTAKPLSELTETLLRSENSLTRGERELIAAYVSFLNDCLFCQNHHGAMAQYYLDCDTQFFDAIKNDYRSAAITEKFKALLSIAASVKRGGKFVSKTQVEYARKQGASDMEIHDTVLIAAAFCMFNRYVDGLATWAPPDRELYIQGAAERAVEGYANLN